MSNRSFLTSAGVLLAAGAAIFLISQRSVPEVVATNLENLPMNIAGFQAQEDYFAPSVYRALNADKHVYRHYSNNGRQVDLYIGYYGTAKGGRTAHNPYGCLPGAGWAILEDRTLRIKADGYKGGAVVNYLLSRKGPVYQVVLHWYQSDGDKILTSGIQMNIRRFLGRMLLNKNDGAFVRVSATTDAAHIEKAQQLVRFFAGEVLSLLPHYWPEEQ
jgi:EpsI family protein